MSETEHHVTTDSGKPFKLVKYFSAFSLVIIVIFAVVLSAFVADRSKKVLLDRYEEYAEVLAANLNQQVFRQFVLPTAAIYGGIDLSSKYQQARIDKVVKATIHSLNVDEINIYDTDATLVYTTGTGKVGAPGKLGAQFEEARLGRAVSGLSSQGSLIDYLIHNSLSEPVKLKTLTPFRAEKLSLTAYNARPVLGVFELVTDLTPELNQIFKNQVIAGAMATGLMAIMFIILALVVRNGEKILLARAEERKVLEDKLRESERLAALGRMVASVSHEIKSPLGIIRSTGELLTSQMDKKDPMRQLTGIIFEECTRLNRIVMEFLDFARPQTPLLQNCDLADIFNRIVSSLTPQTDTSGITVSLETDHAPTILADPDMLYRAMLNIVVNAVQAMPDGGQLNISARNTKDGKAIIEISDTGEGLSSEALDRAFEPFFTLKEQGSGLGLSIVKSIIDAHGGKVEMISTPGRGARMVIRI